MRRIKRKTPWEKLGLSRATWYRLGKPTHKPKPRPCAADLAASLSLSLRTYQRLKFIEVFVWLDPGLAARLNSGEVKIGQLERLLREQLKEHRARARAAAAFTEIGRHFVTDEGTP